MPLKKAQYAAVFFIFIFYFILFLLIVSHSDSNTDISVNTALTKTVITESVQRH